MTPRYYQTAANDAGLGLPCEQALKNLESVVNQSRIGKQMDMFAEFEEVKQ